MPLSLQASANAPTGKIFLQAVVSGPPGLEDPRQTGEILECWL